MSLLIFDEVMLENQNAHQYTRRSLGGEVRLTEEYRDHDKTSEPDARPGADDKCGSPTTQVITGRCARAQNGCGTSPCRARRGRRRSRRQRHRAEFGALVGVREANRNARRGCPGCGRDCSGSGRAMGRESRV